MFPTLRLAKKMKMSHGLPHFKWENVDDLHQLGIGNRLVLVIKKLRGEWSEAKRRFKKNSYELS